MDLGIVGGEVVTGDGRRPANVYVIDGRIAAVTAHAWPDRLDEVAGVHGAGAAFIKAFTCTTHGVPGFDAAHLHELLERAAACGAPVLIHAEDESLTAHAEAVLRAAGRDDGPIVPAWRSRAAEQVALSTAAT